MFLAWSASDRDKAIWQHLRQRQECPGCQTRPAEWDPAQGGRLDAYKASPRRCRGCAAIQELSESPALADAPGSYVALIPNTEVRHAHSRS